MRSRGWFVGALAFTCGCFESHATVCADNTICPPGNVCGGDGVGGCIDPMLCATASDGTACGTTGACSAGDCLPSACGNGRRERDEECDDGNLHNHDGCSSLCMAETPGWKLWQVPQPPGRHAERIAYDPPRGRVLMFGGALMTDAPVNETWQWDGATWTQLHPPASPSARSSHGMGYDPVHQRMIVFSGQYPDATNNGNPAFLSDTWAWDGTTWSSVATTGPTACGGTRIAFDPNLARPMLFGGDNYKLAANNGFLAQQWTWGGSAWAQALPASAPSPRASMGMATDRAGHRVLLFGGAEFYAVDGDTWAWDGTSWTQLIPAGAGSPTFRSGPALAIDDVSGLGVLYGGVDVNGNALIDTWAFSSGSWHILQPPGDPTAGPPMLGDPQLAYDPLSEAYWLVGGTPAFLPNALQTWSLRFAYDGEPEETCIAGQDGDGDGLAGCDDPDCWGYCTPLCPPGATGCDPNAPHCGDGQCNAALEKQVCPQDCP